MGELFKDDPHDDALRMAFSLQGVTRGEFLEASERQLEVLRSWPEELDNEIGEFLAIYITTHQLVGNDPFKMAFRLGWVIGELRRKAGICEICGGTGKVTIKAQVQDQSGHYEAIQPQQWQRCAFCDGFGHTEQAGERLY